MEFVSHSSRRLHIKDGKPVIPEALFQEQVRLAATLYRWRYFHVWDSMRSLSGFPDTVLVKKGRLIFAELKSDHGKVTPAQQEWLDDLRSVPGVEVWVLRPGDLDAFMESLAR